MFHLVNLLGAVALIFWGTYMVKSGMLRTFGMSLRTLLSKGLNNRFKGFGAGFFLSSLLQSSTAATLLIAGLQAEGLVNTLVAVSCIFGAELGSAFVACILSFNFAVIAPVMILVGVVMFFYYKPSTRLGQFGRIVLGLALIMVAINQIVISTAPLRTYTDIAPFFDLLHDVPILSFAGGMILAMICVSSLAAVIVTASLAFSGVLGFDAALWMMIGANAGSTALALLATMFASPIGRRGPWATALCRFLMIVAALTGLTLGLNHHHIDLPNNIVFCHLIFNIAVSLVGLTFIKPLVRLVEAVLPNRSEVLPLSVDYRNLFAQENFLSVSISLSVAKRYLLKELDALRQSWCEVDTLLRNNPNPGHIMMMKNQLASVLNLNRGISVFLNRAISTNLNSFEAIQWQNLKTVNGTLKSAISLVDHTIDVINERKCQQHLDFSSEGLQALTESHRLVLSGIDTLIAYQKCTVAEKKKELSERLKKHQQTLLSSAREQTKLHLLRIANNDANAIETDAIHLEIQSLFNRFSGLISSSVSMELEKR